MPEKPTGLQLWIKEDGHFFVDPYFDHIQVGQTWRNEDGSWTVEVNMECLPAPDLEAAKRLFLDLYDRSQVAVSPGTSLEYGVYPDDEDLDDEDSDDEVDREDQIDLEEGFEIIELC